MPKPGLLLVIPLVCAAVVISAVGSGGGSPPPLPAPTVEPPPSPAVIAPPILDLGEAGWLERSFVLDTLLPAVGAVEVVVELRASWRDGVGHVRVVGRDTGGAFDEVIADEIRRGADLEATLAQYQRMYDELRAAGGSVRVEGSVTVARHVIDTPDGGVVDVWRIGRGEPGW